MVCGSATAAGAPAGFGVLGGYPSLDPLVLAQAGGDPGPIVALAVPDRPLADDGHLVKVAQLRDHGVLRARPLADVDVFAQRADKQPLAAPDDLLQFVQAELPNAFSRVISFAISKTSGYVDYARGERLSPRMSVGYGT